MHTLDELRRRADVALAADDLAALKQLVQDGATFAAFTIQNRTDNAERAFTAWKTAGRPQDAGEVDDVRRLNYWNQAVKRVASVMALDTADIAAITAAEPRHAEELFASLTWGFGPAKASFALACAGIGRQACLDVHMLRRNESIARSVPGFVRDLESKTEFGQKDSTKQRFARYWSLLDGIVDHGTLAAYAGMDACRAQWADWLDFMNRPDAHDILIAA